MASIKDTITVIPYGNAATPRTPYTVTRTRAEVMVARGTARWADDGTRRIYEVKVAARGTLRSWRKVTNRSKNGAALYSSMQLVPGVSQGRNTGGRRGHMPMEGGG